MKHNNIIYVMFHINFIHKVSLGLVPLLLTCSCIENNTCKKRLEESGLFLATVKKLTDVIVFDIFSPPVASRIDAYCSIATYREAAISRLYGGIHYMMAIENGVSQGEETGNHVVNRIQTRSIK